MADAEVLLDYISDFGDGLVALDLQLGELGGGGVLAHDAIFDVVEGEKVTVGFSSVALVGIDLFDLLFCMTTESGAIGEIVGIVDRSWCKGGGQHKAVAGVDRRMFLQTKVGISFLIVQSDSRSRVNLSGLPFLSRWPSSLLRCSRCFFSSS